MSSVVDSLCTVAFMALPLRFTERRHGYVLDQIPPAEHHRSLILVAIMESSELINRFPRLFHMAHANAWPGILRDGLLSTSALLDIFDVEGARRRAIEEHLRSSYEVITHPDHGSAHIRDNKPLNRGLLENALEDLSVEEYLRLLNGKVFFWLTEKRLSTFLDARAFRNDPHLVITVDTERLVDTYEDRITLSPINSGATVYRAVPRGTTTFQTIADYDFEVRRRSRGPAEAIAELAVEYAVPDVVEITVLVEIRRSAGDRDMVFAR